MTAGVGILTTIISGWVTYFFTRKALNKKTNNYK